MKLHIPVAREGWPFILPVLALTVIAMAAGYTIPAAIAGIITLFVALFFRDPERKILLDENLILSPADGRIIRIIPMEAEKGQAAAGKQVSIFMSVFNCHINRVPLSGRVTRCEYNPGRFLPAFQDKASLLNEQNTLHIERDAMHIGIRQIAGLIARRIVCRVKPGDHVSQGDRFGMIRFGSRVDLFLPPDCEILVSPGQKVKAGLNPIARIR